MTRSLPIRNAISALVLLAPLLSGRAAFAQQACGDSICPKGFSCETEVGGACPTIDCVEGPCQPCVPQMVSVCRPGPCSVDADCAAGMACAEVEQTNCTDVATPEPACADGACPELPSKGGTCSTTTSKQCLPRWALPCVADADCGAGFNCKEQQQCSTSGSSGGTTPGTSGSGSSGSSGSAGSGSNAAEPAPPAPTPAPSASTTPSEPPVTTCEPSGIKACEPIRVACSADSGCPSGWTCRDNPEGACWADSNGNTGCTPADPAKLCFPPFVDLVDGRGLGGTDASASPTTPTKGESAGAAPTDAANGGCSIAGTPGASRNALAWCIALGAALGLSRRARRRH